MPSSRLSYLKNLRPLAWRLLRSNAGRLNHPFKLTFVITWQCNSRCTFCNIWQKEKQDELTAAEIAEFFRKNPHFSWIDLTGGEVFLRPDLVEIARSIRDNNPDTFLLHLPTNGLMPKLIEQKARELKHLGFPKLVFSVSLDGPPELHDRLRGVEGGWAKAVETFQRFRKLGLEAYFGMTISDENVDLLPQTLARLKEKIPDIGYRDLHLNIVHLSSHYYGHGEQDEIKQDNAKVTRLVGWFRKRRGFSPYPVFLLEDAFLKRIPQYLATGRTPRPCQALSGSLFIDPAGNVYPCSMYGQLVGDLRQAGFDLQQIWQTDQAKQLYKEIQQGRCPHCWTPCESYQGILGSILGPLRRRS